MKIRILENRQEIGRLGAAHAAEVLAKAIAARDCARLIAATGTLVGVGENGHLAFNEPPADLAATTPFRVVELDAISRQQQVAEGWFETLTDVPTHAITMTVPQILATVEILCVVPDARKARAVKACFGGGVTADAPASALQRHPNTTVYLDRESAALLDD